VSDVHAFTPIELQDLLDNRLPEPRRSEVAAHAADCAICQRELGTLSLARRSVGALPDDGAPRALRDRVLAGLDAIDRETRPAAAGPAKNTGRVRFVVGAGLLAAAAVVLLLVARDDLSVRPSEIAADYVAVTAGRLALEVKSETPAAVEEFFRQRGISFPTRVFDLGMMGYQVAGGSVLGDGTRSRALFVYRGADGRTLICQMYVAQTTDLPAADEVRENNGIRFLVHHEGDLTLVFWQEGDVICVLASDALPEEVIALAFAKAVKA
jgi:anti-sigma factor RsiW